MELLMQLRKVRTQGDPVEIYIIAMTQITMMSAFKDTNSYTLPFLDQNCIGQKVLPLYQIIINGNGKRTEARGHFSGMFQIIIFCKGKNNRHSFKRRVSVIGSDGFGATECG